ncbi:MULTISPECIES: hypothetical protein [Pseudomonadota]|uniref:Uracil-DNA glycosylase-like domain-containing protein n=1 Tax=Stutzerimonas stutzeri TaxID=316 RepID=A0A2N8SZE2_STUST|nr:MULTISPECIES: hypothetical protein [Pseudomonadota]MCQ4249767.1 hypothetical protein [Stutzerimonas stutzeri]PNG07847.1 hypothetical protein CXL00_01990 [Stutzerimonas stutzeri]PNG59739.1 hypothetical protein CHC07_01468 [Variovorax sp. B4]PNG60470.1 hypothetical protein CHC06_00367 [Variovorax sp. B2]VTV13652.1 hypothetical protein WDL1CHR_04300 [Variovorax sp. WDL1]
MTDLEQFARDLERLIGRPSLLRPFVCDGSPLTCTAFIVGFNAATDMEGDFWRHWQSNFGFDKAAWFDEYRRVRSAKPLKPGRTRRQPVSTTRKRTELVLRGASPVRCLETNLYPTPSASAVDLTHHHRDTGVLEFLLERIRPQAILAHGKEAVAYMRTRKPDALVLESSHFASRGDFNDARAVQLGQALANGVREKRR